MNGCLLLRRVDTATFFFDLFFVVEGAVVAHGSVPGIDSSIQGQKMLVNDGTA